MDITGYLLNMTLAALFAAAATEFWMVLVGDPYQKNNGVWELSDNGAIFSFIGRHMCRAGIRMLLCSVCFNVYVVAAMLLVFAVPIWLIFLAAPLSYIAQKLIWKLETH